MSRPIVVTTSWDDGHPCDLRLAELLAENGIPATFYVPVAGEGGRTVLPAKDLRSALRQGFEIGAHTMSHRILTQVSDAELLHEVCGSKEVLEDQLGVEMRMFCYPRGRYDAKTIDCVRRAGFRGARTTEMLSQALEFNRFEMPTSLQAYPHPPIDYLKNLGKRRNWAGMRRYVKDYLLCETWVETGKRLFDDTLQHGGIWHLYGHSWELEESCLWEQLRDLLEYVSKRTGVVYASNSAALEIAQRSSAVGREAA